MGLAEHTEGINASLLPNVQDLIAKVDARFTETLRGVASVTNDQAQAIEHRVRALEQRPSPIADSAYESLDSLRSRVQDLQVRMNNSVDPNAFQALEQSIDDIKKQYHELARMGDPIDS